MKVKIALGLPLAMSMVIPPAPNQQNANNSSSPIDIVPHEIQVEPVRPSIIGSSSYSHEGTGDIPDMTDAKYGPNEAFRSFDPFNQTPPNTATANSRFDYEIPPFGQLSDDSPTFSPRVMSRFFGYNPRELQKQLDMQRKLPSSAPPVMSSQGELVFSEPELPSESLMFPRTPEGGNKQPIDIANSPRRNLLLNTLKYRAADYPSEQIVSNVGSSQPEFKKINSDAEFS